MTVTIVADSDQVTEGEAASFTLTRKGDGLSYRLEAGLLITESGQMISGMPPTKALFGENITSVAFTVPTVDDAVAEAASEITVKINVLVVYRPIDSPELTLQVGELNSAAVTVLDNDGAGTTVTIASDSDQVTEGEAASFTLTRQGEGIANALTLLVGVVETGDMLAVPLQAPGVAERIEVTFEANVTAVTLQVATDDDAEDEPDSRITACPDTAGGDVYRVEAPLCVSVTALDNDESDDRVLSITNAEGTEDTVQNLVFDVTLDEASAVEVTVDYATADGTATAGSDYTQTSGTLTFAVGDGKKTISVPVLQDGSPEEDETFTVTLSDAVNATIGGSTGTGTILDDDPVPASLSIEDAVAVESREAMEFPVTLSGDREEGVTVTVDYATANRTAEAGSDYTETTGSLTFATDVTEQTIRVPMLDDVVDETHEIFVVRLSNAMGATISDALAEGKILDDDVIATGVTLKAVPARVSEDDGETDIAVTATPNGVWSRAIEVTVSVAGSGDADAVDFDDVQDFTIMIAAGASSGAGTFTLTPEDDEVDELDETLSVTGTSVLTVTGTEIELADDDETSSSIALTAEPPRVSEGDGATDIDVTATLDGAARTSAIEVTVSVAGSGNADAVDFDDVRDFTITIAPGDRSGAESFTLTPEDDNVDESDETLNVDGSSVLSVTGDTVTLADDDQPPGQILLSASPTRISEDGGAKGVEVTATLNAGARTVPTTVSVSVAGRGRPNAVDYAATPTSFDITIAAGATTGTETFTVTPEDDEVDEEDEVLDITGTSDLPVTPTVVTLADDERTSTEIFLSAVPSTVSEGAGATPVEVTATLDAGARTVPTTVTVEVTGSGDPDAVDFASVRDLKIMIAAGRDQRSLDVHPDAGR